MTFEEIFILVAGVLCMLSVIISLVAMMSNPYHNSTFKELCGKFTSLAFSICILACLFWLMSYSQLGVYCYFAILLTVILMTIFLYKTARSNFATDMVLALTIILGLFFVFSNVFSNKDVQNNFESKNSITLTENAQIGIEAEINPEDDSEELMEVEEAIKTEEPTKTEVAMEMETF